MIDKITIKNFKAIQSATIKLSDLSVFVGNNGSGKSSVIEALQTLQNVLLYGLSNGFNERWFGLEHIRNTSTPAKSADKKLFTNDIEIEIKGKLPAGKYQYKVCFNTIPNGDLYLVTHESLLQNKTEIFKSEVIDEKGYTEFFLKNEPLPTNRIANNLVLSAKNLLGDNSFVQDFKNYISSWQFLSLEPERMYFPIRRDYSSTSIRMKSTGENLADVFSRMQDNPNISDIILDKMRYVLPDLDNVGREEISIQKQIYLFLQEHNSKRRLPSWLFSSGTLRILAILAILNSETPPSIVFIEEIENGLDPRTLNLLVEEIRSLIPEHQFITTTHSPYFLDLVALKHIIVAERTNGKTDYYRPDDDERLNAWKTKFSAGNLYTMNKLSRT
ncbi:MAG: SMC domain [Prolixibacteraceae bacterium]|nr:MAG: SMC domain [Prolixibacteraceae bacterium]